MTRPDLVRADTIDLQDPISPSAKDHSRSPASVRPLGDGPPAPHQAQSLRRQSLDGYDLHVRSPRGSKDFTNKELKLLHDADADEDGASEGGLGEHDLDGQDLEDDDDDDDLDDDMLDKISSSPSIDDGVYPLPPRWPRRADSLLQNCSKLGSAKDITPREDNTASLKSSRPRDIGLQYSEEDHHQANVAATEITENPEPVKYQLEESSGANVFWQREQADILAEDTSDSDSEISNDEELRMEDLLLDTDGPTLEGEIESDASETPRYAPCNTSVSSDDSSDDASEDDVDDPTLWEDERFVDSGWGGECLREVEDIDFEFVYALHTFVATVEGQANATKGDTMVLLDDSNSYWWLVKVVKDSSIGYLPAEHIETPTERLARLNKHRNIDLSQTMLGDNPDKSKSTLKFPIRVKKAKTVQFTDPTYYEPSEPSYSSDEEDGEDMLSPTAQNGGSQAQKQAQAQAQSQAQVQAQDEADLVEEEPVAAEAPLRISGKPETAEKNATGKSNSKSTDGKVTQGAEDEKSHTSHEALDPKDSEKKDKIRNTDSFYKSDETKVISLTPKIARDDPATSAVEDSRASLDSQKSGEKSASEKGDGKNDKKQRKGVFGKLFFQRKNSKSKTDKEEDREELSGSAMSPQHSLDSISYESTSPASTVTTPQSSKSGKLQKNQSSKSSSSKRSQKEEEPAAQKSSKPDAAIREVSRIREENLNTEMSPSAVRSQYAPAPLRIVAREEPVAENSRSPTSSKGGFFSPIQTVQTILTKDSPATEPKPEKVKQVKNRMALDDSDDSETEGIAARRAGQQTAATQPQPRGPVAAPHALNTSGSTSKAERLSESPIEVSPIASTTHLAPGGSHLDVPPSPVSAVSTPELVERPGENEVSRSMGPPPVALATKPSPVLSSGVTMTKTPDANATPSSSNLSSPVTAPMTPQWSPSALRTYLDSEGADDIRNLILMVHDTSHVGELPSDHEVVRSFQQDQKRLDNMQKKLDDLLDQVINRNASTRLGGML